MTGMKWQEPPATKGGRGSNRWREILAKLQERPGQWALVLEGGSSANVSHIKSGVYGGGIPGAFEATGRKRPDGRYDIYARYVGGESA